MVATHLVPGVVDSILSFLNLSLQILKLRSSLHTTIAVECDVTYDVNQTNQFLLYIKYRVGLFEAIEFETKDFIFFAYQQMVTSIFLCLKLK